MATQDTAAFARATYDAFNRNDFDWILASVAEDVEVLVVPFGQTFTGRSGFRQFMQGFKTAFPDCNVTVTAQVATEDAVVNESIVRGTHRGPLISSAGEIPATGRTIEYPLCEVWRINNGKIAMIHNYFDAATVLQQLGVMPGAPETAGQR